MAWTTPRTWVASEVVTSSVMNTHLRDNLEMLDPGDAWKEVRSAGAGGTTLFVGGETGWFDYDLTGVWGPCRFRRVGGFVVMQGLVAAAGSAGATVFTLPAGYRPDPDNGTWTRATSGSAISEQQTYILRVTTAGAVQFGGTYPAHPTTWISINGVFQVDTP